MSWSDYSRHSSTTTKLSDGCRIGLPGQSGAIVTRARAYEADCQNVGRLGDWLAMTLLIAFIAGVVCATVPILLSNYTYAGARASATTSGERSFRLAQERLRKEPGAALANTSQITNLGLSRPAPAAPTGLPLLGGTRMKQKPDLGGCLDDKAAVAPRVHRLLRIHRRGTSTGRA